MVDTAQKIPIARTLEQFAQRKARGAIELTGKALPCKVVSVLGSIVTVAFLIQNTPNSPYTLPNVTVPIFGPEYIRYPIQPGCLGVVFPADTYLGGVTGLGAGQADLSLQANLSALVFFPVGNKGFSASDDPNALVLYGPDGVILRDTGKNSVLNVNQTGIGITGKNQVIINDGGNNSSLDVNANGVTASGKTTVLLEVGGVSIAIVNGNIVLTGPIIIDGTVSGQVGGGGVINFGNATIETTGPVEAGSVISSGDVTAGSISLEGHVHPGVTAGSGDTGPPV